MSGLVMGLVWELPLSGEFSRAEKFILLAYADHADQNGGNIYPSVDLISRKTGYVDRAVQLATRKLENLGYLVPAGMGPNGTNRFRIPLQRFSDGGAKISPLPKMSENSPEGNSPEEISPPPMSKNSPEGISPEGISPEPIVVVKDSTATTDAQPKNGYDPNQKPNIFKIYEQNVGAVTPMVADDLRDLEKTYPPDWVEFAFREAVNSNARNLKYIRAILSRIQIHGFDNKPSAKPGRKGRSHYASDQQDQPAAQQEYSDADRELAARIKAQRAPV